MIIIAIYLTFINILSLVFCGTDKFCARRRMRRIPERVLLGFCGIALGAGILIAAIFPVGALLFLVAFLLIACGCACCRR